MGSNDVDREAAAKRFAGWTTPAVTMTPDAVRALFAEGYRDALAARGDAPALVCCAWCERPASGTAEHNDGLRHPACPEHGLPGTYRGDAATPTEVEWGVRWPNSDVEKCGAPGTADDYEDESAAEHGGVRVQRTVSAWREVEGGEQRG